MQKAQDFFSPEQVAAIHESVIAAEVKTSGEMRVYIEKHCKGEVLDRAAEVFAELELHKTKKRNGILFYLAVDDHRFAILGDKGINAVVTTGFWDGIKETMVGAFKESKFTEGMINGIRMAGDALISHFPYQRDDVNELPDEVVFG